MLACLNPLPDCSPNAPPIKELTAKTFRAQQGHGLTSVALKAKAKQTWDLWPAVYHLVQTRSSSVIERDLASFLNDINELMKLHNFTFAAKQRWLNAEINFITLYLSAGFHATPKFHLMQHIQQQFFLDCAPRYAYTQPEESETRKCGQDLEFLVRVAVEGLIFGQFHVSTFRRFNSNDYNKDNLSN